MRRLAPLLAVACALAVASSAVAAPRFVVTGRGWGHGVGMSQWGAYGLAKYHGKTYREILAHYYAGTTVETVAPRMIGVLVASGRSSLAVGAPSFTVDGPSRADPVPFSGMQSVTRTARGNIRVGDRVFASPVVVRTTSTPLRLGSSRYRGRLVVSLSRRALRAVNRVWLEGYVKGVVPRESPAYWGSVGAQAALEAQAVAARSYALATGGHCGPGLFCADTRDQVYGGYDGEAPNSNAAVEATANAVVKAGSSVAATYFHSSSGGRTAASVDVWGTSVSYLQMRRDYDLHGDNPHRRWTVRLSSSQLARRLGTRRPRDATLTRDGSRLAQTLTVTGSGWQASVSGSETLRSRLQTKSSRFWIGVLSLRPGRARITWGESVTLRGIARSGGTIGWNAARVQRSLNGRAWSAVTAALPNGAFGVANAPTRTSAYRVRSGNAIGYAARVYVATKVRFLVPQAPYRTLRGLVGPKRAGVTVTLQRKRADGTWASVGTSSTASGGTFSFEIARRGTYRAHADAAAGTALVRGFTPPLTISS